MGETRRGDLPAKDCEFCPVIHQAARQLHVSIEIVGDKLAQALGRQQARRYPRGEMFSAKRDHWQSREERIAGGRMTVIDQRIECQIGQPDPPEMAGLRQFGRKDQTLRRDSPRGRGLAQIDRRAGVSAKKPEDGVGLRGQQVHPGIEYPWLDLRDLIEAAQADNPPSKTVYDPEKDGTRIASLGVMEHWNNTKEKKYSRNLGKKSGIELIQKTID